MKEIELNDSEKKIYAESAALTLYGKSDSIPFDTSRLLTPRRYDDHNKNDLWSTFNIVQENMMKGGLRGLKRDTGGNLRRITTRKIRSIDNDVKLRMVMPRSCRKANQQVPYMGKIFKYGD